MTIVAPTQLVLRAVAPDEGTRIAAAATCAVSIAVGNDVLRVSFEEADWADAFARRYADQLSPLSAPSLTHYVVRNDSGYLFWTPGADAWCWETGELPVPAIVFLADCTALFTMFNESSRFVSFHAAVVGLGGIAAAIAGDSNAGKTTTALACGRAGLSLYSDERCVVEGGAIVPFLRTLNIRRDGWVRVQSGTPEPVQVPAGAVETLDGFSIPVSALFGPIDPASRPELRALFILSGTASRAEVDPVSCYDVAPALARDMHSSDRGLGRAVRLIETLRDVDCYRLRLGTPAETAALIRTVLTTIAEQRAS